MKRKPLTIPIVILLAIVFSIAAALSGPWLCFFWKRASRITQAQDRLLAAMLGWDGHTTVSGECSKDNGKFCSILCKFLNLMEDNHCRKNV